MKMKLVNQQAVEINQTGDATLVMDNGQEYILEDAILMPNATNNLFSPNISREDNVSLSIEAM